MQSVESEGSDRPMGQLCIQVSHSPHSSGFRLSNRMLNWLNSESSDDPQRRNRRYYRCPQSEAESIEGSDQGGLRREGYVHEYPEEWRAGGDADDEAEEPHALEAAVEGVSHQKGPLSNIGIPPQKHEHSQQRNEVSAQDPDVETELGPPKQADHVFAGETGDQAQ